MCRPVLKTHRYAFRLSDEEESLLEYLRSRYRFSSDTEIIVIAIKELADSNRASERAAVEAAPCLMNLGRQTKSTKNGKPKKGRKK